jgi:hypothetical protein
MSRIKRVLTGIADMSFTLMTALPVMAAKTPNVVMLMADDIG